MGFFISKSVGIEVRIGALDRETPRPMEGKPTKEGKMERWVSLEELGIGVAQLSLWP